MPLLEFCVYRVPAALMMAAVLPMALTSIAPAVAAFVTVTGSTKLPTLATKLVLPMVELLVMAVVPARLMAARPAKAVPVMRMASDAWVLPAV